MAGPWSVTSPPPRPGGYINWRAFAQPVIQPNLASIVAIPFTHDWGPYGTAKLCLSWEEWVKIYGSDDTPGSRAVKQAFTGEGVPGYGGAGAVVAYRFGGGAAAAAAVTLNHTATPVLTLTAKYPGTRGNRLNITVRTNAADATKQDLVLLDGQTPLETYTFVTAPADNTPVADLAAQINLQSGFVTAVVVADGATSAPSNIANAALVGGTDGSTPAAGDWTSAMTALSAERFSVFVPYDLTDSSILASVTTWIQGLNNSGKRVMAFCGGAAGETAVTAVARAVACNDPNIVTLGVGSVVDFAVVGTQSAPIVLSTSQLAPRVAGIFAARGAVKPLTFARLAGCDFRYTTPLGTTVSGVAPSDADVVTAIANGIIPTSRDSNPVSPLRLEKGVTTWQSTNTDANRPYKIYSVPRYLKIMQDFEMALVQFIEAEVITPGLPLTQATKEFVLGRAQLILKTMADGGLIQTGYSVSFDTTIPSTATDDFLSLAYSWLFTRSVTQVRNTITVG